jgi:hypothetical protein
MKAEDAAILTRAHHHLGLLRATRLELQILKTYSLKIQFHSILWSLNWSIPFRFSDENIVT